LTVSIVESSIQLDAVGPSAVPAARGGIVSRRALFERLRRASRVTQVTAPTGSGKTFLLRSWIREAGLADSTAWLPLQGAGGDAQQFWISAADALRGTAAGAKLVRPLSGAPDLDSWAVVERLLTDLAALRERLWLVIDDLHELNSAHALRQLEFLVTHAPAGLRFVLSARRNLRLGLHRLRLEGRLTEIRACDLRFTMAEARELLIAAGVTLPDAALARLHHRTEGWAAGLRLAALSLAGHPDPERFAEEFSGSERTVADYLLAEVLERQSEEVRQLLLRTSVLDRVSGPLADLLTGSSGGERILQDLEEAGAFVVSLDAQRSWFRYHRLFGDLLQLQLRRTDPARLTALHSAAASWFAGHGFGAEAIRHAQAAGNWHLAARLLTDHYLRLVLDGQGATAHHLLTRFPASAVAADAELAVLMAGDEMLRGSLDATERCLARAAQAAASVPVDRRGRFRAELAIMRLNLAQGRGDLPTVVEEARRLLAPAAAADIVSPGLDDDLRALALITLGAAELWAPLPGQAERHLAQGTALARRTGRPWLEVNGLAHWAMTARFGAFAAAIERGTRAIELARRHGWTEDPVAGVAYLALAAVHGWQGRLEEAEQLLGHAERALRPEVQPAAGLVLHAVRGGHELARGRYTDALTAFHAAEKLGNLLVAPHPLAAQARAFLLQARIRLGETGGAEATLAEMDARERETGYTRIAEAVLRLAQHDPRAATAALAPVLDRSAPICQPAWLAEALLLEALARAALGDSAAAASALERGLDLAEPDGIVLPFLLHPAPELLERHARQRTAHAALISEILGILPGPPPVRGVPGGLATGRLTQPLTESETRVLRYLPTNLAAPEIAGELSVSVNTVRTHTRQIYAKLGAHRRSEAVERARAIGLLAPGGHRRAGPAGSHHGPVRDNRAFS
jgi:LuxR family maltose regulon positive regulatory protein